MMSDEPDFTRPNRFASSFAEKPSSSEGNRSQPPPGQKKPGNQRPKFVAHEVVMGHNRTIPLPEWTYTEDDLNRKDRDPKCTADDERLACLWPVYLDNFKAPINASKKRLDDEVKRYFASRGLLVRCCFQPFDESDAYYADFQSKAGLYDLLVYFGSERDANFAVEHLHRDTWCGYIINVFPGREPVYFDPDRSVRAENMKNGRIFSEHFWEKHILRYNVSVECCVKYDMKTGAMELATSEDKDCAKKQERIWKYLPVPPQMQKQRFVEKDIMETIKRLLPLTFSDELEPKMDRFLEMLMQGKRPFVDRNKNYYVEPLRAGPGKRDQQKKSVKKQKRLFRRGFIDKVKQSNRTYRH